MKEKYIDLMERALSAYTDEHILRYFNNVKTNGLTEHGFPRLTANIGILITHGRRRDLLPIFLEMMEFCCKTIPTVDAANDFSVREIISCLTEIEKSGVVSVEDTKRWRSYLATIDPTACYHIIARDPADDVRNWVLFTALSEYFRIQAGIGGSMDFIELQISSQLKFFDENGMYMDKKRTDIHQPIMYDLVARGLLALLLYIGYRGRYYDQIDAILKKSALLTLRMQSSNGEMAFGGRSNQFLHNEAWMITVFEHEAIRYAREGDHTLAATFKSAIARALSVTESYLSKKPIRHIKNRFPTETRYGCEKYAYFDKYMITVASNLYVAYQICDDSIPTKILPDRTPTAWQSSDHFHKLFLKSGGYTLEFDTNADPIYDAIGLGRVQREGGPSAICLSCPCPATPDYTVDIDNPFAFSMSSAIRTNDGWRVGAEENVAYEVQECGTDKDSASSTILCKFADDRVVKEHYTVNEKGVSITVEADGEIGYTLPAFCFDGELAPGITVGDHSLTISYDGWVCKYSTNGSIFDLNRIAANRNGHYRVFIAKAENLLDLKVDILEKKEV